MPRRRPYVGFNGAGEGGGEDVPGQGDSAARKRHSKSCHFWKWAIILLFLLVATTGVVALVVALTDDAHWSYDEGAGTITSRHDGADVEVKEGGDLVVHNSIVDSFLHTVYEKITLDPIIGPEGPDLLFGAANATYARLQAFYAIGFRVWDRSFIPIGGIFASNGLFGEDGLAVALDTFANWIHGPIIGTGPGILVISDEAAKENVKSLDAGRALGMVSKLEPRSFDWKGAKSAEAAKLSVKMRSDMKNVHGFVAQEVGAAIPSALHSTADYLPADTGLTPQALMDYNALTVELVGAVQSLWANGVITAAQAHVQGQTQTQDQGQPTDIEECFARRDLPRDTARCICAVQRCGPQGSKLPPPPSPTCLALFRACGNL